MEFPVADSVIFRFPSRVVKFGTDMCKGLHLRHIGSALYQGMSRDKGELLGNASRHGSRKDAAWA